MAQARNPHTVTDHTKPSATEMARVGYGGRGQGWEDLELVVPHLATGAKVLGLVVDDSVCVVDGAECPSSLSPLLG